MVALRSRHSEGVRSAAPLPVGATGDLRRSIQIFRTGDGRVVLGTRLPYAEFVVTGTRPHTPPFEPIQVWSRRVLGNESAAGPVWHPRPVRVLR